MLKYVDVRVSWYQQHPTVDIVSRPARYRRSFEDEISVPHWIRIYQAVVSSALVYKRASAGGTAHSTNFGMYGRFSDSLPWADFSRGFGVSMEHVGGLVD